MQMPNTIYVIDTSVCLTDFFLYLSLWHQRYLYTNESIGRN